MRDATAFVRTLAIWFVPFAIAIAAIGIETDWGRSLSRNAPASATATPQPVAVALLPEYRIEGGVDARRETVDRVLFNPTRRPAPPATQTAGGASAMKHGQYTLTGTTVVGNVATAFLREVNGGKSRSVRQGETLNGVLVSEVKSDRVRLKQGDDVEELSLKIAAGPKTTVQPAPVVQAPAVAQPAVAASGTGSVANPAAAAAGGSDGAARPVVRSTPSATGTGTPRQGSSISELLAERRRAARAAAEGSAAARAPAAQGAP